MATIVSQSLTLKDWAKRMDPDGKIAGIVELLNQTNQVLDDMTYMEGNLPTGHQTTIRSGLPTTYWRAINAPVPVSKSTSVQITEPCARLEAWSEPDAALIDMDKNPMALRLSEAVSFMESMSQQMAETLFYGNNATNASEFTGLSQRYSTLDSDVPASQNTISLAGTGSDNTSIWLVCWGDNKVHGIFPGGAGMQAGLKHEDLGRQVLESTDDDGVRSLMEVYRDCFKWHTGLVVKDWRYAVRLCNIDVSNLAGTTAPDLIEAMAKAIHRIPSTDMGGAAFYMNRTCFQWLDIQRLRKAGSAGLTYSDVDGKETPTFRGIPIRQTDALLETEARVTS